MPDVILRVHRTWTARFEDEDGRKALHSQRSRLMHNLADALELEVKDWGETDVAYPREVVEIIVALGSAGIFTALVSALRLWLDRDKIKDVEIEANGVKVHLAMARALDVKEIAQAIHLNLRDQ